MQKRFHKYSPKRASSIEDDKLVMKIYFNHLLNAAYDNLPAHLVKYVANVESAILKVEKETLAKIQNIHNESEFKVQRSDNSKKVSDFKRFLEHNKF